jgi:hypothetical protein
MGTGASLLAPVGMVIQWLIQQWVRWTGKLVHTEDVPWLVGVIGDNKIGADFYQNYARNSGLEIIRNQPEVGLLEDFNCLRGADFDPERVDPKVKHFYERTVEYTLDVWLQWSGVLPLFAKLLITLVSRPIEQLNLPLSSLETSRGMSSEILRLIDKSSNKVAYTGWLRKTVANEAVVYAGFYTTCRPPNASGECVKVVFPLPSGSTTVILRPENQEDGSFKLISAGTSFGSPGYYRIHQVGPSKLRVKYIPIKETIHVYQDAHQVLRTDHIFMFWGYKFLTLHYKMSPK